MNVLLLGYGQMGKAIAHGMKKLDHELTIIDSKENGCMRMDVTELTVEYISKFDIVVSSLPYFLNLDIAKKTIEAGVAYCDLGGHVDTAKAIYELAKDAKRPVLSDVGLAPGFANLLCEKMYQENKDKNITQLVMMVGGIPQHPEKTDPLKYTCTWSIDGLINEYKSDCLILQDGEIRTIKALSLMANDKIDMDGYELEAFNTSGGASNTLYKMQERGIQNCYYLTLRYKGHRDMVIWMLNSGISKESMEKLFSTYRYRSDLVSIAICASIEGQDDIVENIRILSNNQFSAMQMATGLPAAAFAHLLMTEEFETNQLDYSHINYNKFEEVLNSIT